MRVRGFEGAGNLEWIVSWGENGIERDSIVGSGGRIGGEGGMGGIERAALQLWEFGWG